MDLVGVTKSVNQDAIEATRTAGVEEDLVAGGVHAERVVAPVHVAAGAIVAGRVTRARIELQERQVVDAGESLVALGGNERRRFRRLDVGVSVGPRSGVGGDIGGRVGRRRGPRLGAEGVPFGHGPSPHPRATMIEIRTAHSTARVTAIPALQRILRRQRGRPRDTGLGDARNFDPDRMFEVEPDTERKASTRANDTLRRKGRRKGRRKRASQRASQEGATRGPCA